MGAVAGQPLQDSTSSMSPWTTQIVVDNTCTSPIRVFLCRDSERPSVKNAVEHVVPAQQVYAINSGWVNEPRATLLMRTSVNGAHVFRMAHSAKLKLGLVADGVSVYSNDDVLVEEFHDPGSVPNNDTVPMILRSESFTDRAPGSEEYRNLLASKPAPALSQLRDNVASISPWCTTISVQNNCHTPVKLFLCRNAEHPSATNAIVHTAPAQSSYAISSGWLTEPRATLLVRVGIHEATIFRVAHAAELKVDLSSEGLLVTTFDDVVTEAFHDPGSVPNHDTVPMATRGVSFTDRRPGSHAPRSAPSSRSGQSPAKRARGPAAPPQFALSSDDISVAVDAESKDDSAPDATVFGAPVFSGGLGLDDE